MSASISHASDRDARPAAGSFSSTPSGVLIFRVVSSSNRVRFVDHPEKASLNTMAKTAQETGLTYDFPALTRMYSLKYGSRKP